MNRCLPNGKLGEFNCDDRTFVSRVFYDSPPKNQLVQVKVIAHKEAGNWMGGLS